MVFKRGAVAGVYEGTKYPKDNRVNPKITLDFLGGNHTSKVVKK